MSVAFLVLFVRWASIEVSGGSFLSRWGLLFVSLDLLCSGPGGGCSLLLGLDPRPGWFLHVYEVCTGVARRDFSPILKNIDFGKSFVFKIG